MFEYNGKDEETAFDDELWCYDVGDDINFLPRNAVYSIQIELREIKKVDENFEMTVAVQDPDSGEYTIFTEKLKKGSVLLWDDFEPGYVCFTGRDRVAVKLTVIKISEKSISFIKEYDR